MAALIDRKKTPKQMLISYLWTALGAFLAALSIRIFLMPHELIDGGVIGIAMILCRLTSDSFFGLYYVPLTLPFLYLSYRFIRRNFFIQMIIAVMLFAFFTSLLGKVPSFDSDPIEVIVVGGAILGIGVGLIIRNGGCLDGTEILAIIINRRKGFTIGQVVLSINVLIFVAYGWIFQDWHIAIRSLLTFVVAYKMMDLVIVGLDELKSVTIITKKTEELKKVIMHELGLGLTVMYGRGGFSGSDQEILMVIVERLDLSDLKEIIMEKDPAAFVSVHNLHEVIPGKQESIPKRGKKRHAHH